MAVASRIDAQIAFLNEADKLKDQLRATPILSNTRPENSAEHSWHIMLYALTLAEHANRPIQIDRVLKMLLLHDIVEIDAGDAPIHGDHDPAEQEAKEIAAAERIFGLLPADQRDEFRSLWEEFEAAESDDAIFAKSIDRVQPVISNLETGGGSWIDYNVTAAQLESRVGVKVRRGAPAVWDALKTRIDNWFASLR
jgi:putative hydrolase of HD superfamily